MQTLHFLAQASNGGTGAFAIGGALMIVIVLALIATSLFWLWMLVDCLTSSMPTPEKLLWFLVIFFLHFIGAVVYFAVRRSGPGKLAG